jgi:hypothetical protein
MTVGECAVTISTQNTVLDALVTALGQAADFNHDDVVPPAAVLWPDEKREWERLVPRLRMLLPHFLIFGPYDTAKRTGPAIWLRCVLSGKIPDITWPPGAVPIIYLPGVSRSTLKPTEDCPPEGQLLGRSGDQPGFSTFLGAAEDLIRNIHGVASVAELDGDEVGYLVAKVAEIKRQG